MQQPDLTKPVFAIMPEAAKRVLAHECVTCAKQIRDEDFRNQMSEDEYSISGMCQDCQDSIFEWLYHSGEIKSKTRPRCV